MPQTYVCPSVSLPEDMMAGKRSREYLGNKNKRFAANQEEEFTHKKLRLMYSDIKEFSASALNGTAKNKFKEDKLTKLGVPPPKQATMPLRMKLGVMAHKKKKLEKEKQLQRESGVVQGLKFRPKANKPKKVARNKAPKNKFPGKTKSSSR